MGAVVLCSSLLIVAWPCFPFPGCMHMQLYSLVTEGMFGHQQDHLGAYWKCSFELAHLNLPLGGSYACYSLKH